MRRLIVVSCVTTLILFCSMAYAVDANKTEKTSPQAHLLLANAPPGLAKKGMVGVPSKVPPGWDEGVKRGWNKDKDWRWDKKNKVWENKNWQWDKATNQWNKIKNW